MWRLCDLHNHTSPNESCAEEWDVEAFIRSCVAAGLDVVGVTDHDSIDRCEEVASAAGDRLIVVPGVELSTDRGHVLLVAPGDGGVDVLREFLTRVGARPGNQIDLLRVFDALGEESRTGDTFAAVLVAIGAHVDMDGQLLGSPNALSIERQLTYAARLNALEVARDDVFDEWLDGGVKQGPRLPLLRGSDTHDPGQRRAIGTWLYLPEVSADSLQHALALPEASIRYDVPPSVSAFRIEELEISEGPHAGHVFTFCERTHAVIGPPNSGKSLIVDALKAAFSVKSDIDEVEEVSERRMAKCLPPGTVITVRAVCETGRVTLVRTIGGADQPTPPFRPIVFSQTELVRRAHEPRPSIRLLDVHCPEAGAKIEALQTLTQQVIDTFNGLVEQAMVNRRHSEVLGNSEDGLAATRQRLRDLAGTEDTAKAAMASSRVARWREKVRSAIEAWKQGQGSEVPLVPPVPDDVASDETLSSFAPSGTLEGLIDQFEAESGRLVARHAAEMLDALDRQEEEFGALVAAVANDLRASGFEQGSEVEAELKRLRERLHELEELDGVRRAGEITIDDGLVELRTGIDQAAALRAKLTEVRKDACRRVNASMRTFFAVVDEEAETELIDGLIDDLKTGTYMRPETRRQIRDQLERQTLLEDAVRLAQGRLSTEGEESDQDRLLKQAMDRSRHADLARLAVTWPGDGLDLRKKGGTGAMPAPFVELTEGLRALAIKEISFAASALPVITDQPEDAVPTRAVYESLVPTLREQRSARQFIVVSHDANIVVASDVESVTALQGSTDGSPYTATLFDGRMRELALEHLEGGVEAFTRRANMYGRPLKA